MRTKYRGHFVRSIKWGLFFKCKNKHQLVFGFQKRKPFSESIYLSKWGVIQREHSRESILFMKWVSDSILFLKMGTCRQSERAFRKWGSLGESKNVKKNGVIGDTRFEKGVNVAAHPRYIFLGSDFSSGPYERKLGKRKDQIVNEL